MSGHYFIRHNEVNRNFYSFQNVAGYFLLIFSGAAIGYMAWPGKISAADTLQNGLAELSVGLLSLLILPLLWSMTKTRWQAALPYFFYILVGTRDIPFVYSEFFPGTFAGFGVLGWLAQAAFLSLPWVIMWHHNLTVASAIWRVTCIVMLLSFPPFGFIGWLNPLVLAGYMYPGTGWFGVVMFVGIFSLCATIKLKIGKPQLVIIGLLIFSSVATNCHYQRPTAPKNWAALSTKMGPHPLVSNLEQRFIYHGQLINQIQITLSEQQPSVLFLPESIAGTWLASTKLWWQPVANQANAMNTTLLVGADHYVDNNQYFHNSLVNIGNNKIITADRFPMPLGQWRPWTSPSAKMNIFAHNAFTLQGQQVGMSVCYEDFVFWLQALTIWETKPTIMVSIANNWFAQGMDEPWIQARHIQLWADLWGVPLLRAVNV